MVKHPVNHTSQTICRIDALQKGSAIFVGCRVSFDITMTLNFFQSDFKWLYLMNCSSNWCKAQGSDSVTYWAHCIIYDHTRGLDIELKIKVCNHLISIMREPIGMIQASWYLYPVLPFVDRFHSKLPVIKLKIKNTLNSLYTNKNIFSYHLFHFLLISSFLILVAELSTLMHCINYCACCSL